MIKAKQMKDGGIKIPGLGAVGMQGSEIPILRPDVNHAIGPDNRVIHISTGGKFPFLGAIDGIQRIKLIVT